MIENDKPNQQSTTKFELSWHQVNILVDKFLLNNEYYLSSEYQEAHVRDEFIDKLFVALGWDVNHNEQHDPYRQEVRIEKPEKKAKGRADYAFSISPQYKRVRFFVEAKRPQVNIATADNCFQAIRYSWPQRLPIAVLTDFNYLYIIDSRYQPKIDSAESRIVLKWHCSEFKSQEKFAQLYWLLSRDAVSNGSIELFAETELPQQQSATKQYSLFAHEAREFDDVFLQQLDDWRQILATAFKKANKKLTNNQLTECVQRTLDRLVFIRFLEDKRIEPDQIVARFGQGNKKHWHDFITRCKSLDQTYNGIVFKPHSILDSRDFDPDSTVFAEICDELTDDHSPYNFDSIPVEILGRIYERFLGKVVQTSSNEVSVVEKEDVRKAGGVFYTPDYIVAYMVDQSLGAQVANKKPDEIIKLRIIDTACGSGSFLIGTFSFLLEVIAAYYRKSPKSAKKGMLENRDGDIHLSLSYKREILKKCIYGVDIDTQAVEVAQLSLYLKLMEDETTSSAHQQQIEIGVALLPTLTSNIVVGNSLVTLDHENDDLFSIEKIRAAKSLDFKAAFPDAFNSGGFDLVIGNPPYIKEYTNKDAFEHVRSSPYYQGKMDLWYLFACRAMDWLKNETGILAYIATNNWVTNSGAKKLREKITADACIDQLIDFGDFKVFKDAGVQTMILIAKKCKTPSIYQLDYRRLSGAKRTLTDAQGLLEKVDGIGREYLEPTIDRTAQSSTLLTFTNTDNQTLLNKIASKSNFKFDGKREIAQGIVAPQDSVNATAKSKLGNGFSVGQGVFIISDAEKKQLGAEKAELRIIKPYYTSSELGKYAAIKKNKLWVIYTDSRFKKDDAIAPYPSIKKHLDKFSAIITSDNYPYGLHRARDENFFIGEKIISLRKCGEPTFTYTDFPCYVSQTYNVIKTDRVNLHFLTGLLNSRLIKFWLKHQGKMQGQNFQIDKEPLLSIPLCIPSKKIQEDIAKLVNLIIKFKLDMPNSNTDADKEYLQGLINQYDNKIARTVEDIYELSEDERVMLDS
jgi:adenine-specific DNA-methyltransferase